MIARTTFAATLAACAIAAPAASAATGPDLSKMALAPTDLGSGTSVLAENSFSLGKGAHELDRYFKLRRSSGFTRLNNSVVVLKRTRDAQQLLEGTRLVLGDPDLRGDLAKLVAGDLGVHVRRVRVGKPRTLHVGDGGFTVNIRVNGKVAIVVGVFRIDRGLGEVDARGTRGAGLLTRTRGVVRVAAGRMRAGLSPQPISPPTITGTAQVGATLQALPGTWSDATSLTYAWQRCNAAGTCVAVPGATQPSYTVTAADAGSTLRVVVTAANAVGPTTSMSAPTAPVPAP